MKYDDPYAEVVYLGLCQIPRDGLERLKARIESGKPVCYTGWYTNTQGGEAYG